MSLSAGTRLGPYEILSALGAGGMGEVYRARDTKLNRDVAIKVLPDVVATDPERLARFHREAQVLASLNHPNIAAIYGFEDSNNTHALVMELVEGPTLADRIEKGPIPIDEALPIARQIAEALETAHEQGIIHRDLKPANIKVREDGTVKVLDFGLAKLIDPAAAGGSTPNTTASPTLTSPAMMTGVGVILGTAAYMSPEQARGKPVDKRADIWAFGCVLYEMLIGRRAFARDTVTDTLAAILEREPDWTALPASTPSSIDRLLRRCLEKDPKRRLHDVADARIDIEDTLAVPPTASAALPSATPPGRSGRRGIALYLSGALLIVLVGAAAIWALRRAPSSVRLPPVHLTLPLGPGNPLVIDPVATDVLAISPDGMSVAYVVARPSSYALYLRALSSREARFIAENRGPTFYPFFSPDSQWLAFAARGKLRKVPVRGGQPVDIADVANFRGGSWGDDGSIVFAPVSRAGLSRVSSEGGMPETLTALDASRGESSHRMPWQLPGGQSFLYVVEGTTNTSDEAIWVHSLKSKQSRLLIPGATLPSYASTGHLLYVQANTLMAVAFDPVTLTTTGTPAPVVEGVGRFAVSQTGSLLYGPGETTPERTLVWVDRQGREAPLAAAPDAYDSPRLSPDGAQILLSFRNGAWAIYDIARDTLKRVIFENKGGGGWAIWTPDGQRITYASNRPGTSYDLFTKRADGTGGDEPLLQKPLSQRPSSWSPDGGQLAFTEESPAGNTLWVLSVKDKSVHVLSTSSASEGGASYSPDGRWLAYHSNETGHAEVYVRPASSAAGKWRVSTGGGTFPLWAGNGRELFYRSGEKILAVDVGAEPVFAAGKAHLLFERAYVSNGGVPDYDVARDGQRFLMVKPDLQGQRVTEVNVVQNWFEELQRLVPTR